MNEAIDRQATWIKILAVVTATPRWIGALLAAEGLVIPAAWSDGWVIGSAIMSAAMAAVEGWAFSYVFEAWRNQEDAKGANRLGWLIFASAILFMIVLAPYIAASVMGEKLANILAVPSADGSGLIPSFWLFVWSVSVGASTIAIVASVGYAQKHKTVKRANPELDQANAAVKDLRRQLKDTETALKQTEQRAAAAELSANEVNGKLDAEIARANAAEQRAEVAESQATTISAQVEDLQAKLSIAAEKFGGLFAEDKRQRILAARQIWPDLNASGLATVANSSPSYVSEVLNGNGKNHA